MEQGQQAHSEAVLAPAHRGFAMRFPRPRLRTWHLIGLVAAAAAFFAVLQFRRDVDNSTYLWMRRLRSLDAAERVRAVRELSGLGPVARPAIEPLVEALADSDARVRRVVPEA